MGSTLLSYQQHSSWHTSAPLPRLDANHAFNFANSLGKREQLLCGRGVILEVSIGLAVGIAVFWGEGQQAKGRQPRLY